MSAMNRDYKKRTMEKTGGKSHNPLGKNDMQRVSRERTQDWEFIGQLYEKCGMVKEVAG